MAIFVILILFILLLGEYNADKAYEIFISRHVHDMSKEEIRKELIEIMLAEACKHK